jgi:hypothetical protein
MSPDIDIGIGTGIGIGSGTLMKKHAPATLRNRKAIVEVLAKELPATGTVLEVASGSGEHALYFAQKFPLLKWQPSDPDREALASIIAHKMEYFGFNLRIPLVIDACAPERWEVKTADAIVCINMVHIAPWEASVGLFKGAAQILSGKDMPLILYGPFFEQGIKPVQSNLQFDADLRARDQNWGIRVAEELDTLASANGFARTARHKAPANNLMLVYRRAETPD